MLQDVPRPTLHGCGQYRVCARDQLQRLCGNEGGRDVVNLYRFLLVNPKLRSNPISYWIDILNRQMNQPDDRQLMDLAVGVVLDYGNMNFFATCSAGYAVSVMKCDKTKLSTTYI